MKQLFRFFILTTVALTALLASSCSKSDDNMPTIDPDTFVNAAMSNDMMVIFQSVVIDDTLVPGKLMIGATPDAGVKTYDQLTANNNGVFTHPYFVALVDVASLNAASMDVKTTRVDFALTNMLGIAKDLVQAANGSTDVLASGILSVRSADGKLIFDARLKLTTGESLVVNINGDYIPAPAPVNKFIVDGREIAMKSVFVEDQAQEGYAIIGFSEEEGLDTFAKMTEMNQAGDGYSHRFMMITVPVAGMVDTDLNLMTTESMFSFVNMSGYIPEISLIGPGSIEGITAGSLKLKNQNGKQTIDMSLTLSSSERVSLQLAMNYNLPAVADSDYLSLDGEVKSVKTAYYEPRSLGTALYLTPSQISSAISLNEVASYYVMLYADDVIANGNDVDITKTASSAPFEFRLVMPASEQSFVIKTGDLQGATGTFNLADKGDGKYAVKFNITVGGHTIIGDYEQVFARYQTNIYLLNDDPLVVIKSAVVVKESLLTTVYLSADADLTSVEQMQQHNPIVVTMPTAWLGIGVVGFSGDPMLSIALGGKVYNAASDSAGNADVSIDGTQLSTKFQLFDLGNGDPVLLGQYVGNCVVL